MVRTATALSAFALAAALGLPGAARAGNPGDVLPGTAMQSCAAAKSGGGGGAEVVRGAGCQEMHSLDVVRKGPLGVPFTYGQRATPMAGGGEVVGWDGGAEGGPVYRHAGDRG